MEEGPPPGLPFREYFLEETARPSPLGRSPQSSSQHCQHQTQCPLSSPYSWLLSSSIKALSLPALSTPVPLQDYIHSTHGKEMDLLRTTVKVPGKRPPRAISAFGPSASINGLVKDMSTVQMGEGPGEWDF